MYTVASKMIFGAIVMTQDTALIISLQIRQEGEFLYVTSRDLPALNICGLNVEGTYQSVCKAVKALVRHNWGYEVEIIPATTDGKSFPKTMGLCEQLVLRKAA